MPNYLVAFAPDSVLLTDTIKVDSVLKTDNKIIEKDTSKILSDDAIETKITYIAKDSIRFLIGEKKMYLFGNAEVKYEDITLKSDYIEINMDSRVVLAKGTSDSLGKVIGKPVFLQNEQTFKASIIEYNMDTKKGKIYDIITKEGDGVIHGEDVKKHPNNEVHICGGKYTTCDLDHPHFYIKAEKIKVIPDDKIVTGPAYLVVEDVPLPLVLPFGIFPNKKGAKSGVLIPSFDESANRGFFLKDLGYFINVSDKVNTSVLGDIYSNGSWGLKTLTNYKTLYKYNGSLNVSYSRLYDGLQGLPDTPKSTDFFIRWTHSQDAKARPNSRFSANVNAGTGSYHTNNPSASSDFLSNTFSSSVSYQKTFAGTPFNMSVNLNHSQNSKTKIVSLGVPEITFNMNRIFPFERKSRIGSPKVWEKISVSYNFNIKNELKKADSLIFSPSTTIKDLNNGIKHSIPISTNMKLLSYFNLTPSFVYTERWYPRSVKKEWDETSNSVIVKDVFEFSRAYDYNFNTNLTTKLYGLIATKKNFPLKALRHVLTPSVGYTYKPDFSKQKWGFYDSVQVDTLGNKVLYSKFDGGTNYWSGIYGSPSSYEQSMLNFSISNNLEIKIRNRKDTITGIKKVVLIEDLRFSSSYNFAADSLKWSKINISGRTKLFNRLYINYTARLDPYVMYQDKINSNYYNINIFEYNKFGRLARMMDSKWSFSLQLALDPKMFEKKDNNVSKNEEKSEYFKIPWNVNVNYSLNYGEVYYYNNLGKVDSIAKDTTHTIDFNGGFDISPNWRIGYRTGYDIVNNDITYTELNLYRSLHCWELEFKWIPYGMQKKYEVNIHVKSPILEGLKVERKKDWRDAYQR